MTTGLRELGVKGLRARVRQHNDGTWSGWISGAPGSIDAVGETEQEVLHDLAVGVVLVLKHKWQIPDA